MQYRIYMAGATPSPRLEVLSAAKASLPPFHSICGFQVYPGILCGSVVHDAIKHPEYANRDEGVAPTNNPSQKPVSYGYGDAVAVAAHAGASLSRQRYAAIDRMVSGADENRSGYREAAAGAVAPDLAVAGTGVEVVFQMIAAAGHAARIVGSAAAGRERNVVTR